MPPRNSGANTMGVPLRFGVLGAASINENAIVKPCFQSPQEAVIKALAARDRGRAEKYIAKFKLKDCEVFGDYQTLLDKADIDAVYIPSPNGLHYEWTMKALRAGRHVLCEKPFASNAEEARAMVALARERGLVLMEAAHWFYHPFRQRMQEIIASGQLGALRHVYANFSFPGKPGQPRETKQGPTAIRYDTRLAGGCLMDCGWYALNCVRALARGEEPTVEWAEAARWPHDPEIDEGMKAGMTFQPSGVSGTILCSYCAGASDGFAPMTVPGTSSPSGKVKGGPKHPLGPLRWDAEVTGTKAVMHAVNFGIPHTVGNRIIVRSVETGEELLSEAVDSGGFSTYDLMVLAFCSHVRQVRAGWATSTEAFANTGQEPVKQMEIIDKIYAKAGLRPRSGPSGIVSKL